MLRALKENKWITVGGLVAVLLLISGGYVRARPSSLTLVSSATATTSPTYLSPTGGTATSTFALDKPTFTPGYIANQQSTDALSVYLLFTASSSVSGIEFQQQVSNNGIDWYAVNQPVGTQTGQGLIALASTSNTYLWVPGNVTASTTGMAIKLSDIAANHARVVFWLLPGAGNGAVYAEADLKQNPQNP